MECSSRERTGLVCLRSPGPGPAPATCWGSMKWELKSEQQDEEFSRHLYWKGEVRLCRLHMRLFCTVLSPPAERKGRAQCTGSSQVGWFRNQAPWPAWVLVHLPNSFRKHASESFTGDFANMFHTVWFDRTPQVINVCVSWTHCSQRGPGSSFP